MNILWNDLNGFVKLKSLCFIIKSKLLKIFQVVLFKLVYSGEDNPFDFSFALRCAILLQEVITFS